MSFGDPLLSRWTDGTIPGMRENCSYAGYKGPDRAKGIARAKRAMKRMEAEIRDAICDPRNRASFRRLDPESQAELLAKLGEPVIV